MYTYQYDKRGNQIELEIDCYEKIIYYEKSKYDLKDQIIESEIWDHETDKTIFYIFEYDHLGNTILESGTQDGQLQFKIEHFYDHNGQLIRTDETNVEVDDYYVKIKNTIVQAIV